MRFDTLLFLLSLSFLCLALAQVSYDDCCLKYVKLRSFHQKHAVMYKRQETDGGCNIPAIIFTLRKGRRFCADPRKKEVSELMGKIDKKESQKLGKHKSQQLRQSKRG